LTDNGPFARVALPICAAQFLTHIGAFFWPAFIPKVMPLWNLNGGQAGWITSSAYATYLISSAWLLLLTDRLDTKKIYVSGIIVTAFGNILLAGSQGFWSAMVARAFVGVGSAGTYMIGLKLMSDLVSRTKLPRAVALNAAVVGVSAASSFGIGDWIAGKYGWRTAFVAAAVVCLVSAAMVITLVNDQRCAKCGSADSSFVEGLASVLRNRPAMVFALLFCFHSFELNCLRGWGVAFLAFVASQGTYEPLVSPAGLATTAGLLGTVAGFFGNEIAMKTGRIQLLVFSLLASLSLSALIGSLVGCGYSVTAPLFIVYNIAVYFDSSSLTVGTADAISPQRRGAALAVHSFLGNLGSFLGPVVIGIVLEYNGGLSNLSWSRVFLLIAGLGILFLVILVLVIGSGRKGLSRG
jgi:MFS family permease